MRALLIACLLTATGSVAHASGGLDCSVEDAAADLNVHGGVTRGMGGPLYQFEGTAEIKGDAVAADLRKTVFVRDHVAQYWLDGQSLRLELYREREGDKPHGYVEVTIMTQAGDDEGVYGGTYSLHTFDTTGDGEPKTVTLEGPISCFVE